MATVPLNVRSRGGHGDVRRTLDACERLLDDRDDMVTKAMSGAIRELVVHDRDAVDAFMTTNTERLATTNYDMLLERAIEDVQGTPADVVIEDGHIGLIDETRRTSLVKLHGCL